MPFRAQAFVVKTASSPAPGLVLVSLRQTNDAFLQAAGDCAPEPLAPAPAVAVAEPEPDALLADSVIAAGSAVWRTPYNVIQHVAGRLLRKGTEATDY